MFDNLKNFMQGESWVPLSLFAGFMLLRYWNKGDWVKFLLSLFAYTVIMGVTQGPKILHFFGDLLRLIAGWDTGL